METEADNWTGLLDGLETQPLPGQPESFFAVAEEVSVDVGWVRLAAICLISMAAGKVASNRNFEFLKSVVQKRKGATILNVVQLIHGLKKN